MSWICPHCNHAVALRSDDIAFRDFDLTSSEGYRRYKTKGIQCPNPDCDKVSVYFEVHTLRDVGQYTMEAETVINQLVIPSTKGDGVKEYPDYIPTGILQDYREACAISDLSPKASATLARRCLQGMIRDFWQVKPDTLYNEIQSIKDEISSDMWGVIDGVRKVGNIGAHMEKDINLIIDVNPEEATLLINMIEMLLDDWYVARFEKQQRIDKMKQLAVDKTQAKKP